MARTYISLGYTYLLTPDNTKLQTIAAEMSNLIYHVNGRSYTYGAATTLYITNGDTSDWVYGTFRAPAFTIELPPIEYENGGFFAPETLIDLTFNENLPALLYFVNYFVGTDVQEKENPVDKEMIRASEKRNNKKDTASSEFSQRSIKIIQRRLNSGKFCLFDRVRIKRINKPHPWQKFLDLPFSKVG